MVHDNETVKDFQKERDRRKTGSFSYDEGATVSATIALNLPGRAFKGVHFNSGSGEELATAMCSLIQKKWGALVAVNGVIHAFDRHVACQSLRWFASYKLRMASLSATAGYSRLALNCRRNLLREQG